jgi:hypothetical protein
VVTETALGNERAGQYMITIWKYHDAPQELKYLMPQSSTGTWVLIAPAGLVNEIEAYLQSKFGLGVFRHEMAGGAVVFIGESGSKGGQIGFAAASGAT